MTAPHAPNDLLCVTLCATSRTTALDKARAPCAPFCRIPINLFRFSLNWSQHLLKVDPVIALSQATDDRVGVGIDDINSSSRWLSTGSAAKKYFICMSDGGKLYPTKISLTAVMNHRALHPKSIAVVHPLAT